MPGFTRFHDLDSSTTFCPCHAHFVCHDRTDPVEYIAWMAKHTPHTDTDEIQNHITDDGMRCLTEDSVRSWASRR